MDKKTLRQVQVRAGHACEYCRLPEKLSKLPFVIDHVIARQHGGASDLKNLALACGFCTRHKGPNVVGVDPVTGAISRLFHPRQESWTEHFRWERAAIIRLSPVGRATVAVLAMNDPLQLTIRQALLDEGL